MLHPLKLLIDCWSFSGLISSCFCLTQVCLVLALSVISWRYLRPTSQRAVPSIYVPNVRLQTKKPSKNLALGFMQFLDLARLLTAWGIAQYITRLMLLSQEWASEYPGPILCRWAHKRQCIQPISRYSVNFAAYGAWWSCTVSARASMAC